MDLIASDTYFCLFPVGLKALMMCNYCSVTAVHVFPRQGWAYVTGL